MGALGAHDQNAEDRERHRHARQREEDGPQLVRVLAAHVIINVVIIIGGGGGGIVVDAATAGLIIIILIIANHGFTRKKSQAEHVIYD